MISCFVRFGKTVIILFNVLTISMYLKSVNFNLLKFIARIRFYSITSWSIVSSIIATKFLRCSRSETSVNYTLIAFELVSFRSLFKKINYIISKLTVEPKLHSYLDYVDLMKFLFEKKTLVYEIII